MKPIYPSKRIKTIADNLTKILGRIEKQNKEILRLVKDLKEQRRKWLKEIGGTR